MPQYIKKKLKILEELSLSPTKEEIEHMKTLMTEIAIDNCVISIRNRCWQERYGDY